MADVRQINSFLQERLESEALLKVRAVEAARWLDAAGLLKDSDTRRGKPLRDLLRAGRIEGAYQESGRWWRIRQIHMSQAQKPKSPRLSHSRKAPSAYEDAFGAIVTAEHAKAAGFTGFLTVGECMKNGLPSGDPSNSSGVYILCAPEGFEPEFIPPSEARAAGNVSFPWPVDRLTEKWVKDPEVLYIGKSTQLRRRLRQLIRHAQGRTVNHTGGEIVWQLRGFERLIICWRNRQNDLGNSNTLIQAFKSSQKGSSLLPTEGLDSRRPTCRAPGQRSGKSTYRAHCLRIPKDPIVQRFQQFPGRGFPRVAWFSSSP